MQRKVDLARTEFMNEGNQMISQLSTEIEKRKPSLMNKAFNKLRAIVTGKKISVDRAL